MPTLTNASGAISILIVIRTPFRTPAIYYTNETSNCFEISAIGWRDPQYGQRAACQNPTRSEKNGLSKCKRMRSESIRGSAVRSPAAALTLAASRLASSDFAAWWDRRFEAGVSCSTKRLSDCSNRTDHEVWLILHDPVATGFSEHMTALRQTMGNGHVMLPPLRGRGLCGQDDDRLVAKITQLCHARGGRGHVVQLARYRVAEFFLKPKNRRHLSFISGQIPKPRTGYRTGLGGRSSTNQPHETVCHVPGPGSSKE